MLIVNELNFPQWSRERERERKEEEETSGRKAAEKRREKSGARERINRDIHKRDGGGGRNSNKKEGGVEGLHS